MPPNPNTIESLNIRSANIEDLPDIAEIHKLSYSRNHFTALLSTEALERYYSYFLSGGSEIYVVVEDINGGESVQAFAVFGTGISEKISRFKRECIYYIFRTSLRHPITSLCKAIEAIDSKLFSKNVDEYAEFILLSIASKNIRRGFGKKLLQVAKNRSKASGFNSVGLFVNCDNINAVNSYFKSSFIIKSINKNQYYMECNLD